MFCPLRSWQILKQGMTCKIKSHCMNFEILIIYNCIKLEGVDLWNLGFGDLGPDHMYLKFFVSTNFQIWLVSKRFRKFSNTVSQIHCKFRCAWAIVSSNFQIR